MNLQEIKERHSKIGGTPWKASEYSTDYYTQGYRVKTWNDGEIASCIEEKGEVDFIANAPSDIAFLLSIIEQATTFFEKVEVGQYPGELNALEVAQTFLKAIREN